VVDEDRLDGLAPGTPDPMALRRRVLGTAVLTLALFLAVAYLLTALDVSSAWLLLAVVLLYALVVRPLMRPVHEATALRRRLAYQSYLDEKDLP
jgi:fatty acid desaturase